MTTCPEFGTNFEAPLRLSSISSGSTKTPRSYFATTIYNGPATEGKSE
jgi:hypothetical protein